MRALELGVLVLSVAGASAARGSRGAMDDTPCLFAASEGNLERVMSYIALDEGRCARERSSVGETALHVAALSGNARVANALLKSGCDANARTHGGQYLSMTPLHWWVYGGEANAEGVEALLRGGADANAANSDGKTALDMAYEQGDFGAKVREILVRYGGERSMEVETEVNDDEESREEL